MATIDLGKLGFVNKGTYNNSTTYEKNDLVQFTDGGILSTYLYIDSSAQSGQAPSSSGTAGSRWVYYAKGGAAGADGTDVAAVLNNNEIAFKTNAGALDGIAIGSAGQALKVNSGANGFEFGSANSVVASSYPSSSLASGYEKNINGLIIQWGAFGTLGAALSGSVSFPLTFPSYIYSLSLTLSNNNNNGNTALEIQRDPSTSGFSWWQNNNGQTSRLGHYIAIGK
tara:strand:+ start:1744 stop:2421 length:678 start_codon:yes stop_codon:yes gene_type:complete